MTNEQYWKIRKLIGKQQICEDAIIGLTDKLRKQYEKIAKKIKKEMTILYAEIQNDVGGEVLVSHLYQYNRYYEMLNNLQSELNALGGKEVNYFTNDMTALYKKQSKLTTMTLNSSIRTETVEDVLKELYNINQYTRDDMLLNIKAKEFLKEDWVKDGKIFSDRIWEHKTKLLNALEQGITEAITVGGGIDTLKRVIDEKFESGYGDSRKLAATELMHTYNSATLDSYESAGVSKVKILTAKDSVANYNSGKLSNGSPRMQSKYSGNYIKGEVCQKCIELDGDTVYNITEAPTLPIHPFCRCCYLPVVNIE